MAQIIDIHTHISMRRLNGLHTDSATPEDLKRSAQLAGVNQVVILATHFPMKKGNGNSAAAVAKATNQDPFFMIFGTLDASQPNIDEAVQLLDEQLSTKIIRGIKLYPGYQNFRLSDRRLDPIYELAESHDVPVMFHGGTLHGCCDKSPSSLTNGVFPCGFDSCPLSRQASLARPSQICAAARCFPKVRFIVAHMAHPHFEELRQVMRQHRNVYTDTSGQYKSGTPDAGDEKFRNWLVSELDKILAVPNGPERVLFGTDFPIQSYPDSLDLIEKLNLPQHEKDQILYQNAVAMLKL